MVPIGAMASAKSPLNRRTLIAGLGTAALSPVLPAATLAQRRAPVGLKAISERLGLRPDGPETEVWALAGPDRPPKRGETVEIGIANELPAPLSLHCRGIDGAAAEPLLARAPLAAGANETFPLSFRHAGTFLCDPGLLGDGQVRPFRSKPLIVPETENVAVDRDEVMLIEEWHLRPDRKSVV